MRFLLSKLWSEGIQRQGSLVVVYSVWGVMLGGVYASVYVGSSDFGAGHPDILQDTKLQQVASNTIRMPVPMRAETPQPLPASLSAPVQNPAPAAIKPALAKAPAKPSLPVGIASIPPVEPHMRPVLVAYIPTVVPTPMPRPQNSALVSQTMPNQRAPDDVPTNDVAPVLIGYAGPNVGQQIIANARHLVDVALSGPSMVLDRGRELVADLGPNRP